MLSRRDFCKLAGTTTALFLSGCSSSARMSAKAKRPNIIFLLADDMGYSDMGLMGSDLNRTPNLDKLAEQSMFFSKGYAPFPTCLPSRMAYLTGKNPARLGCWNHGKLGGVDDGVPNLPLEEVTYGEVFKKAGYVTGHIGKWHAGGEGHFPEDQGFDYTYGYNDFCCIGSYYYPFTNPPHMSHLNPRSQLDMDMMGDVDPDKHLTMILAEKCVDFLEENKDKPFLLNYWCWAPHTPINADTDKVERYREKVNPGAHQRNEGYAALIEHYDDAVGLVLDTVERLGIADNTIIIFTSDNGGAVYHDNDTKFNHVPITSNFPLRDGKHSQYEGGVRVPFFIKWPGITNPGTICDERVIGQDLYPTMLAMAGLKGYPRHNSEMDGYDLTPLLRDPNKRLAREALHWLRYPELMRYLPGTPKDRGPKGTIIKDDWKLIEFPETLYGQKQSFELYHLKKDVSEVHNLADKMPGKVQELKRAMYTWRQEVGAPVNSLKMYQEAIARDPEHPLH